MTRLKLFPLLILVFIQINLHASDSKHIITLKEQTILIKNFGFHIEKVINATGEEKYIGYFQKKSNYRKIPAFFDEEISVEIADFLKRNLLQVEDNDFPLYVRIDGIHIFESYDGINEKAVAKTEFTFFTKKDETYYQIFTTSASKEMAFTKWQPELIAEAIALCFENLYYRHLRSKLKYTEVTEQEIFSKPKLEKEATERLLAVNRNKAGIYNTFYDFQLNTPDTTTHFEVTYKLQSFDEDSLIKSAKIYNSEDSQDLDNIWGFNDGKNIFIRVKNRFILLDKDDKGYYISIKVYDNAQMYYAGLLGGLIGSSITEATTPKTKVRLNILNGSFEYSQIGEHSSPLEDYNPQTKIILLASRYNNGDLDVTINDTIHLTLAKGTWYEYSIPPSSIEKPITVTVKSANGLKKVTQITSKANYTDIYLCIEHKKKAPSVSKVLFNKRQGYLDLMTVNNRVYSDQD